MGHPAVVRAWFYFCREGGVVERVLRFSSVGMKCVVKTAYQQYSTVHCVLALLLESNSQVKNIYFLFCCLPVFFFVLLGRENPPEVCL